MDPNPRYSPNDFIKYRAFLRLLAEAGLDPRLGRAVDPSDIVQIVFLKATQAHGSLRAQSDAELAAWLRAILKNTLHNAHDAYFREEGKLGARLSIDRLVDDAVLQARVQFSGRLPEPPARVEEEEAMLRIAVALEKLPADHRQVVVLRQWHKWSMEAIAQHLGRTHSSVVGLYRRGIAWLGEDLKDL